MITTLQNSRIRNFTFLLFSLTLVFTFFPVRYIFLSNFSAILGEYSDFTSFSLYLSDIFLLLTFFTTLLSRGNLFYHVAYSIKILFIWVIIGLILSKFLNFLNIYAFLRLLGYGYVAYGTFKDILGKYERIQSVFRIFSFLTAIQSIIALCQFTTQKSLGFLHKIGESVISIQTLGVAKIVSGGTTYIRGYGTFPHPNILGAFLATGVLITLYLIYISTKPRSKIIYTTILFINILGLTVSFSRSAYLGLVIGLILFFSLAWLRIHANIKHLLTLGAIVLCCLAVSFTIFLPFLASRANVSDTSNQERALYNNIGWKIIQKNSVFGVGIGESMLHMKQFSPVDLKPWQIQPIHNYYLIAAAELGIPGLLILLWIFGDHIWVAWSKIKDPSFAEASENKKGLSIVLVSLLITFLALMLFDHYFYTLYQGQILLWLTLAAIASFHDKQTT